MVPHPVGQIGSDSMNFRSETTGSKQISSLITNLMVSGSVWTSPDRIFQGRFFDFSEKVFLIVLGSGGGPPRDQRHRGARVGSGNCFFLPGDFSGRKIPNVRPTNPPIPGCWGLCWAYFNTGGYSSEMNFSPEPAS